MLQWLKAKIDRRRVETALKRHYEIAVGTPAQRSAISISMTAIEHHQVQKQRDKLRADQQNTFMIAYECCVMWAVTEGFRAILDAAEIEDAITAMRAHFGTFAYFETPQFDKVWASMQMLMPQWNDRNSKMGPWPVTLLIEASNEAGFPLDHAIGFELEFGYHVLSSISRLIDVARFEAQQQVRGGASRPHTALDVALDAGAEVVVSAYRRIASQHGCAPSSKTSDATIVTIYFQVCTAFTQAAERRGQRIPAVFLNRIVLKFLQLHEAMPESFDQHLRYEIDKYSKSGLRPEYQQPLKLVN